MKIGNFVVGGHGGEAPSKGTYTVRLYFSDPNPNAQPGSRIFDVTLAGKKVLSDFDVAAASDGVPRTTMTKAFKGVELADGKVIIQLGAKEGATIISGVELLLEE